MLKMIVQTPAQTLSGENYLIQRLQWAIKTRLDKTQKASLCGGMPSI